MDTPRDVPHQSPTACCLPSAHDSTWDIAGGDSGGGEKYLFIKRFISKNYKKKKFPPHNLLMFNLHQWPGCPSQKRNITGQELSHLHTVMALSIVVPNS